MSSYFIIKCSNMLLLLFDQVITLKIFSLKHLIRLTHYLRLLKCSFLLIVKLPPQLNHLILLNSGLILENLSKLFLINFQPLSVFLHI